MAHQRSLFPSGSGKLFPEQDDSAATGRKRPKFLERFTRYLLNEHGRDLSKICVVFPNRRPGLFLREELKEAAGQTIWAPEITTFKDWVVRISGLEHLDPVRQLFALYASYQRCGGEEDFESFLQWGEVLLRDFDELDRNLVEGESFFKNLYDLKIMSAWEPGGQSGEFLKKYHELWKVIKQMYTDFRAHLLEKKQGYEGLIYQQLAKELSSHDLSEWDRIYFTGFNALTRSEEQMIQHLLQDGKAELFWDTDAYYHDDPVQEAGHFFRKYEGKWRLKDVKWKTDELMQGSKTIDIIGVAGKIGQSRLAGDILANKIKLKPEEEKDTAIILADEHLLLPLIEALPQNVDQLNITMGMPFRNTPLFQLLDCIFSLQMNLERLMIENRKNYGFYHRDLVRLLNHAYVQALDPEAILRVHRIKKENIIFLKDPVSSPMFENRKDLYECLIWRSDARDMERFDQLIDILKSFFFDQINQGHHTYETDLEYLFHFRTEVHRLKEVLEKEKPVVKPAVLRKLFRDQLLRSNLPFEGEPLRGLQVMGMLETRVLDFRNVVILSMNEGIFPKARHDQSLIPYDVKKMVGLPTYYERDAIYAYLFYRLMQGAENVYLVYNTQAGDLGGEEKSRFLAQLKMELAEKSPHIKLRETLWVQEPNVKKDDRTITIAKGGDILEKLHQRVFEKGLSPSSLSTYVNCSLQFYFSHVAGISEEETVEETMEAKTMGDMVHLTLEDLYKPWIGKPLDAARIRELANDEEGIERRLRTHFDTLMDVRYLEEGKNYLLLKVCASLIRQLLLNDAEKVEKLAAKGDDLKIIALEEELKVQLPLAGSSDHKPALIKGTIDRVETSGQHLTIIDYKTGRVNTSKLKIKDLEEVFRHPDYAKGLQLLVYSWMFDQDRPTGGRQIEAGIYSLRALQSGLLSLSAPDGSNMLQPELFHQVRDELEKLIAEILDPALPFQQTGEEKHCKYCDFKEICLR